MNNAIYKSYTYNINQPYIIDIKSTYTANDSRLHWHRDIEIIYVISGSVELTLEKSTIICDKDSIIVINSNTFHKIKEINDSKLCRIIVSTTFLQNLFALNICKVHFKESIDNSTKLTALFNDLLKEIEIKNFASQLMQEIIIKTILIELYRSYASFGYEQRIENTNSSLNNAIRYIDEHFLENLTIDDICSYVHFSKSYFCTKFKQYTGMTVSTYINNLRIHHAKELISQKDYPVQKAALESGFNNVSYFTRTFKKVIGTTPSNYLRDNNIDNSQTNKFGKWPERRENTYYQSVVGADFCVTWTEEGALTHSHWFKEDYNRMKPVEHGYYSSGDEKYLTKVFIHLKEIGIDYLLLEDTNGHWNDLGYIARNITNCFKTADNLKGKAPMLAITSGLALKEGDIKTQHNEVDIIYYDYVDKYPSVYFKWENKPLLVLLISENVNAINTFHDNRFTIRYGTGLLRQQELLDKSKEEDNEKYKFLLTKGNWARIFNMQNRSSDLMGVQIGYCAKHKEENEFYIDREKGNRYIRLWLDSIKANPKTILISSYNNHQDETAIEAAIPTRPYTKKIPLMYEEDPFLYEKITEAYLALKHGFIDGFYYREEHGEIIYQCQGKHLKIISQSEINPEEPIILIPDDYLKWYN